MPKHENATSDMAKHAGLISLGVYGILRLTGASQSHAQAMAAKAGGAAFLYMGTFGHGAPTKLRGPFFGPKDN